MLDSKGNELIQVHASLRNYISQKILYSYGVDESKTILQHNCDETKQCCGFKKIIDGAGRLIKKIEDWQYDDFVSEYYYDSDNLLESEVVNNEYYTEYIYDDKKNLIRVENSEIDDYLKEKVITMTEVHSFNSFGERIKTVRTGGGRDTLTIEMNYDRNGNLVELINKNNKNEIDELFYFV